MNINCIVDVASREVSFQENYKIAAYDHNVDVIHFSVEPIEDFSLDTSSIRIAAQGPNKARHDYAVDPSTVAIEEETGYITFDWPIPAGVTEMPIGTFKYGDKGQLIFAVCAEIIDGSTVSKAWHSDDGIITVVAHLEPEAGGETPEEQATNAQKIAQLQTATAILQREIGGIASGTPPTASTIAEMDAETSTVYIYTGSESGESTGYWYYYNGTTFVPGGQYGGAVTSTTFNQRGVPADDFAVGQALADKADADDLTAIDTRVTAVEGDVDGKADSTDVDTISDDLSSISNIVTYTPYGENLIPTSPTYVSWIDPAKYDFSAAYDINKIIFSLKVLQSVSGAKSIRFGTASTGYTPVDLTGKLVRITASPTSAFNGNVIFVVIGISDDGTQTKTWNITLPTVDGEYAYTFDCDIFESRTGYKNLFLSGFYLTSSFSADAGQEYKIVVEIASESDIEDGWTISERLETKTDKIINMLPKVVYGFSRFNTHGVNHRGFRTVAPENTLPAFRLSKQKGFDFVETDVQKTSDGVYVLLHDETINRTARNDDGTQLASTINISDITYAQALEYDFGIFKGAEYAGTRIPTLEQFIVLCSKLELYPYIELKQASGFTETDIVNMLNIVRKYHMEKNVTWISFSWNLQHLVFLNDPDARVGWLGTNMNSNVPSTALTSLSNGRNECFIDANYNGLTSEFITLCKNLGIKLEVYNAESENIMTSMDEYISGATSDSLNYQKVIYDANIGETDTGIVSE